MGIFGKKDGKDGKKDSKKKKDSESSECKFKHKYEIKDELGSGAFSVVYLCVRRSDGEQFAAKCIEKVKSSHKCQDETIENEIAVLKQIDHPNIVKLEDLYEDKHFKYLVMELVSGGELFDTIVERGNYSEKDAADCIRQILNAVAYLHEKNIVHRDLKPENLLYKEKYKIGCTGEDVVQPRLMVSDFGLSKSEGDEGMATACGTPGYVAPEVLCHKGAYGKEVDCWSIGVIAYILLCGYPPFYHEHDAELFKLIMDADYQFDSPYWDEISQPAKDFVKKFLTKDSCKRMTCAEALKDKWLTGEQSTKNIADSIQERLNATLLRKKWQNAIRATTAVNRMKMMSMSLLKKDSTSEEAGEVEAGNAAAADNENCTEKTAE